MLRLPLAARCCLAPAAWCADVPVLTGGRDPGRGQGRRCRETPTNRDTVLGVAAAHPNGHVRSSEPPVMKAAGRAGLRTFTATCASFGAHLAAVGRMARKRMYRCEI